MHYRSHLSWWIGIPFILQWDLNIRVVSLTLMHERVAIVMPTIKGEMLNMGRRFSSRTSCIETMAILMIRLGELRETMGVEEFFRDCRLLNQGNEAC